MEGKGIWEGELCCRVGEGLGATALLISLSLGAFAHVFWAVSSPLVGTSMDCQPRTTGPNPAGELARCGDAFWLWTGADPGNEAGGVEMQAEPSLEGGASAVVQWCLL